MGGVLRFLLSSALKVKQTKALLSARLSMASEHTTGDPGAYSHSQLVLLFLLRPPAAAAASFLSMSYGLQFFFSSFKCTSFLPKHPPGICLAGLGLK